MSSITLHSMVDAMKAGGKRIQNSILLLRLQNGPRRSRHSSLQAPAKVNRLRVHRRSQSFGKIVPALTKSPLIMRTQQRSWFLLLRLTTTLVSRNSSMKFSKPATLAIPATRQEHRVLQANEDTGFTSPLTRGGYLANHLSPFNTKSDPATSTGM